MSEEKVVSLKLVSPAEVRASVVNADAVGLLEEHLAKVRAGEVVAVGLVAVYASGAVGVATSDGDEYHRLNSGAARLAARLALE
jgi:hypothetical protein